MLVDLRHGVLGHHNVRDSNVDQHRLPCRGPDRRHCFCCAATSLLHRQAVDYGAFAEESLRRSAAEARECFWNGEAVIHIEVEEHRALG